MKFALPAFFPRRALVPAIFLVAAFLCLVLSFWTAMAIERFSRLNVRHALDDAGFSWVDVKADGLLVELHGTAPTEAARFRVLSTAINVIDSSRLRDRMDVAAAAAIKAPDFALQILRNEDGISIIGLAPASMDRKALVDALDALATDDKVTDLLETADQPVPPDWERTVAFATQALINLPRAKLTVTDGRVRITAISDSPAQKAAFESMLRRSVPKGVELDLNITAPHPVITPFTLRFLIDKDGARFDACSADSEAARARILRAATDAGALNPSCTLGLGVPTPAWSDAAVLAIDALHRMGRGTVTFSDTDIALVAESDVTQATFDRAVGELESNLPDVFSLRATLQPKSTGNADPVVVEFTGERMPDGRVDISGRLTDDLSRQVVESFARATFGSNDVHAAIRIADGLPPGWGSRVLVALDALGELNSGKVVVHAGDISVTGITGSQDTQADVARLLSSKLGQSGQYNLAIRYEKKLDPLLGLPTADECASQINDILNANKIAFEPGSAVIDPSAKDTLDKIAALMKNCSDYPMEVGGHTDSQGREEMNLALSDQRARAVIAALQDRRIITSNLTPMGYGETVPLEPNNTEAGREKNRRIEFRLVSGAQPAGEAPPKRSADAAAGDEGTGAQGAAPAQPDAASGGSDISVFDNPSGDAPADDIGSGSGDVGAADGSGDGSGDGAAPADQPADQPADAATGQPADQPEVQTPPENAIHPKGRPDGLKKK